MARNMAESHPPELWGPVRSELNDLGSKSQTVLLPPGEAQQLGWACVLVLWTSAKYQPGPSGWVTEAQSLLMLSLPIISKSSGHSCRQGISALAWSSAMPSSDGLKLLTAACDSQTMWICSRYVHRLGKEGAMREA